jgi:hypothetical protein
MANAPQEALHHARRETGSSINMQSRTGFHKFRRYTFRQRDVGADRLKVIAATGRKAMNKAPVVEVFFDYI